MRELTTVSRETWQKMLRIGHQLDINKDGLYDSRSGCINIWSSPEDKPKNWQDVEIFQGALNYPRSYVGGVYGEHLDDGKVKLEIEVSPYERAETDYARDKFGLSKWEAIQFGYPLFGLAQKYMEPTEDEWEWVTQKVQELIEMALTMIEPLKDGVYCKFCDGFIKCLLLNDFLEHLHKKHDLEIYSVGIGDGFRILTNAGEIVI